jgi:hypothetical protein
LLLWFYLSGLVIVIGAEMNATIEHAPPWVKAPGEKGPGQKKKIGAPTSSQSTAVPGTTRRVDCAVRSVAESNH